MNINSASNLCFFFPDNHFNMPVLNGYITRRVTFAKGFGGTIKQWFCLLLKSCSINLERPLIRCACLPAPIPPVFLTFIFHKCSGKTHGHTDKPYSKLYYRDFLHQNTTNLHSAFQRGRAFRRSSTPVFLVRDSDRSTRDSARVRTLR